jgi:hypothetical protein
MNRFTAFVLFSALFCAACLGWPVFAQSDLSQAGSAGNATPLVLPAGSKVEVALTIPVWAKTAKPSDPLYMQTNFPVTLGDRIVIPAGTYVEGRIEAKTRPTRKLGQGELQILFTKIIFANGYTVV